MANKSLLDKIKELELQSKANVALNDNDETADKSLLEDL